MQPNQEIRPTEAIVRGMVEAAADHVAQEIAPGEFRAGCNTRGWIVVARTAKIEYDHDRDALVFKFWHKGRELEVVAACEPDVDIDDYEDALMQLRRQSA